MRCWKSLVFGGTMLGAGYLLGSLGAFDSRSLPAQEGGASVTQNTAEKIESAQTALRLAAEALQAEGQYEGVTDGVNAFLVLAGGGNAVQDLEGGMGVDPETFAALYANQATPEIQERLDRDADNRVLYNGQVVRMYSPSRLQRMYAERVKLTTRGKTP